MILDKMRSEIPANSFFILSDADVLIMNAAHFHRIVSSFPETTDVVCMIE